MLLATPADTFAAAGCRAPTRQDLRCRTPGCRCACYQYLPSAGAWHAKCACKHASVAHDARTRACTRCACTTFAATFSCGCGAAWAAHATAIETRAEREAAGRAVDNLLGGGAGYEALGGITSFASLTDGACRARGARRAGCMP